MMIGTVLSARSRLQTSSPSSFGSIRSSTTRSTSSSANARAPPRRRAPGRPGSRRARAGRSGASGSTSSSSTRRMVEDRSGITGRMPATAAVVPTIARAMAPPSPSASAARAPAPRLARAADQRAALPRHLAARRGCRCSSPRFTVAPARPLPPPTLPPAFDARRRDAARHRARAPLSRTARRDLPGALRRCRLGLGSARALRLRGRSGPLRRDDPGPRPRRARNLVAVVPGARRDAIVVIAHRDNTGDGPGANDNASGTAALIELARGVRAASAGAAARPAAVAHARLPLDRRRRVRRRSARRASPSTRRTAADVAGRDQPRRDRRRRPAAARASPATQPRSPAAALVANGARSRRSSRPARDPERRPALRQLVDLGFPFSLYEQAPFVARGIPAVTLTTAGDRAAAAASTTTARRARRRARLAQLGRAAAEPRSARSTRASSSRRARRATSTSARAIVRGWAIELVLIAALLPFSSARSTSSRAAGGGASRSRRRCAASAAGSASGAARGAALRRSPCSASARTASRGRCRRRAATSTGPGRWSLGVLGVLAARRLARRPGAAAAAAAGTSPRRSSPATRRPCSRSALVALLVVATNPFALIFVLPSLHAWLWLPQVRAGRSPACARARRSASPGRSCSSLVVRRPVRPRRSTRPGTCCSWSRSATSRWSPSLLGLVWLRSAAPARRARRRPLRAVPERSRPTRPPRGPVRRSCSRDAGADRPERAGRTPG